MGSRVELFAGIRRDARVEELSIRELARRYRVSRKTVRRALSSPIPPPRKTPQRISPRLEPFKSAIDAMLIEDTTAPRKQRHTAKRILARLIEEHAAQDLSYSTVRDYVRVRRAQIDVEAGRRVEVFVPQEHAPGAEAEVDFGEVWVMLNGVKTKCHMFVFRLSRSGKAIHRIYPTQAQEAFLEGHIEAFREIGGIPTKHIRYDNLTSAVTAVVFGQGRQRVENERWVLFKSAFNFDAFYCQPGISGAHEKGGVEGEVGWFRRNRLTPMPVVESLDELNDRIRVWEEQDERRRINDRIRTIGEDFTAEAALPRAFAGRKLRPRAGAHPQSRPILDDHSPDGQILRPGTAHRQESPRLAQGFRNHRVRRQHGRRPSTPGSLPKAASRSSSTTTWKSSEPNLAPSPDPRHWPGRGRQARSLRRMRHSGQHPAGSTGTRTGPGN